MPAVLGHCKGSIRQMSKMNTIEWLIFKGIILHWKRLDQVEEKVRRNLNSGVNKGKNRSLPERSVKISPNVALSV